MSIFLQTNFMLFIENENVSDYNSYFSIGYDVYGR